MNQTNLEFVNEVNRLQLEIARKLSAFSFTDPEAAGAITHHLAEACSFCKELGGQRIPAFLSVDPKNRDAAGEIIVDIVNDLEELKEAIIDMEHAMVLLMNHLTS